MISEWFVGLWETLATWLLGLMETDSMSVPAEVVGFDDTVNSFLASLSGTGVWVPWPLVMLCAGLAIAIWAGGWLVKGVAWIYGQVPVFGGAG